MVVYQRPDLGPPRVRVKGDSTQKTQIIFLLDCSGSMKEKMAVEGQQEQNRLQIARSRLLEVLGSLDEEIYQVGLILYGHRAGWEEYERGRYRIKWRSEADQRRKLHPAEDVELVVPVRPIKYTDVDGNIRDIRDVIAAKLDDLIPYGETPLYLAIIEALNSFNQDLPGPKHVVAVTDGVNDQTADGARQEIIKVRANVQQALTNPLTRADRHYRIRSQVRVPERGRAEQVGQRSGGSHTHRAGPAVQGGVLRSAIRAACWKNSASPSDS